MPAVRLDLIPPGATTRFAPSPTGLLHLGHAVNAVWTWGVAQATGARVLLRIEDHDRGRCRPEYETAILRELEWLGLEPDARDSGGGFRQSDHHERYRQALAILSSRIPVDPCRCSRKAIALALGPQASGDLAELRYPGTCRSAGLEPGDGLGLRAVVPDETIDFVDLRLGPQSHRPAAQCGDLLLEDPVGNWTYQFSVTVDDLTDGVDLVIRGQDLLESTGRQILLARLLGRAVPPRFLHHPILLDDRGAKLSKRDRAAGLAELRASGWAPERVLGEAAFRSGLLDRPAPVAPRELGRLFLD